MCFFEIIGALADVLDKLCRTHNNILRGGGYNVKRIINTIS